MTRKPNLFVIGAMKSGTTALHYFLDEHPEIFMSPVKEPTYFIPSRDLYPSFKYMADQGFCQNEARYLGLYEGAGEAVYRGESSTFYTKRCAFPRIAPAIASYAPEARIVYIMRDPVERAISHFWFNAAVHHEHRDMMAAVRNDPQFLDYSHYAWQLQPYIEHFGLARIKTLTTEALRADPVATLRELFAWLGVDAAHEVGERPKFALNRRQEVTLTRDWPLMRRLLASDLWDRTQVYVPDGLRQAVRRFYHSRRVAPAAVDTRAVAEFLRPIQRRQTEELSRLLGRDFPEWTTLYAEA